MIIIVGRDWEEEDEEVAASHLEEPLLIENPVEVKLCPDCGHLDHDYGPCPVEGCVCDTTVPF